jgi:hypothetical protein
LPLPATCLESEVPVTSEVKAPGSKGWEQSKVDRGYPPLGTHWELSGKTLAEAEVKSVILDQFHHLP